MVGIEYSLLIVQEPILYVIRKVHRQSPDKGDVIMTSPWLCISGSSSHAVIPLADYYVLGGVVYQCPDLQSIINSRMVSLVYTPRHEAR